MVNHDPTGSDPTLDTPSSAAAETVAGPLREAPGRRIGPYKLLQLIGEGGFGSVFMAEQEKPVVRKVALKIIKLGMDTRQVVARFEQERQALAMMDHPNIARVLDAGATETGRPFFVMELVKGDPIVEYCDKNNLSIQDRLELFAQVCNAVQHAHTKGIIHRDIKPSNILVSTQDGKPHTKVIDFGIAKATASKLTEKTLFTEHRQLIGTPEYMSPEQAEGSLDIDTRTDVYSLGVLLYELLTGTTPFSSKELRSAAYAEIQRIIREVEPPKPSTRLSNNTDTIASVAAQRRVKPRNLGLIVRGELDWIVMKALEKDRQRRYETANGLALDIRRYLAGEAVVAAPPSSSYRLRKFIRRNRVMVVAGSAVALSLVLGLAGTAWQAKIAADKRDEAIAASAGEKKQRLAAEAERIKAEKIAEFMSDTLQGVGPSVAKGRDITMLKEMMDAAAARIENGDLKSVPDAELRLRDTVGRTYQELALYDAAARMFEPALTLARSIIPGDSAAAAKALYNLASLLKERGHLAEAEPLARESLAMRQRLFPGENPQIMNALSSLASILKARGDLSGAEQYHRESLEMARRLYPGDHVDIAGCLNNVASVVNARGDLAGAESLYRDALAMKKRLHLGDDPTVADGLNNLASVLKRRDDLASAESLYRESLEMRKRIYAEDHPDVADSLNNLAALLYARDDLAGAEPLMREAMEMTRRLFPGDHQDVAENINNLAMLLQVRGDLDGAEPLLRESLAMTRRLHPGDHLSVATALNNLAALLNKRGDLPGAERLFRESLEMAKRIFPGDHPDAALGMTNLASVIATRGDLAAAESLLRSALAMRSRLLGDVHPDTLETLYKLASVLVRLERFADARPLVEACVDGNTRRFGPTSKKTRDALGLAVKLYESWDKAEPDKGYGAKAAEWKEPLRQAQEASNGAAKTPATTPTK